MVNRRRGGGSLGCLVTLLLLAAVAYLGWDVGELYFRNYQYHDAMRQAVQFADRYDDAQLRRRLRAKADSLELPMEAKILAVRRHPARRTIEISAEYTDTLRTPIFRRAVRFAPHAEGRF